MTDELTGFAEPDHQIPAKILARYSLGRLLITYPCSLVTH